MRKLIKSSLYLTSLGLIGSILIDILFILVANRCQHDLSARCAYTMIGLAICRPYVFIPIILISFLLVLIPALIYLKKKIPLEKFHIGLIVYSLVAFFVANYLGHFLIVLFF
jgi:hypothetical protein